MHLFPRKRAVPGIWEEIYSESTAENVSQSIMQGNMQGLPVIDNSLISLNISQSPFINLSKTTSIPDESLPPGFVVNLKGFILTSLTQYLFTRH